MGLMDLATKLVELDASLRQLQGERDKLAQRLYPSLEAVGGRIRLAQGTVYVARDSRTRATLQKLREILGDPLAKDTWAKLPHEVYQSVRVTRRGRV
jgi:hypothetical protein